MTYDHYLEEPGSLEVEYFSHFATQRGGNDFHAYWSSSNTEPPPGGRRSSTSTGRPRSTTAPYSPVSAGEPLPPAQARARHQSVLYVEYEQISEADKIMKEVEGHDVEADTRAQRRSCARSTIMSSS